MHAAIDKLIRPKLTASVDKIIDGMDPKKEDPYHALPDATLKEMCQKWWKDEHGEYSNEFGDVVNASRDAIEDVYRQYLVDHPDVADTLRDFQKKDLGLETKAEETQPVTSVDIFKNNPDALINKKALKNLPKAALDIINKLPNEDGSTNGIMKATPTAAEKEWTIPYSIIFLKLWQTRL